jgi:hypothetical protein
VLEPVLGTTPGDAIHSLRYHITTTCNETSILNVHPSAGWARPIARIIWGSSAAKKKDRERLTTVEFEGESFVVKEIFAKTSTFGSSRLFNAGGLSILWNQCVYASPGFPFSVFVASDPSSTNSSSTPRFLAQLNIKRIKPAKDSRSKHPPADVRLELRTEDESEVDAIVMSAVLLVAGKWEWEKLDEIMAEAEAEERAEGDWTAPPPVEVLPAHPAQFTHAVADLPPAYA